MTSLEDIEANFALLDEWEDRYRYIIELGRTMPPFPQKAKITTNIVEGCASQVWLLIYFKPSPNGKKVLHVQADSDAFIVRGLLAIIVTAFDGVQVSEAVEKDVSDLFKRLGLFEHLSNQRANGATSVISEIKRRVAAEI